MDKNYVTTIEKLYTFNMLPKTAYYIAINRYIAFEIIVKHSINIGMFEYLIYTYDKHIVHDKWNIYSNSKITYKEMAILKRAIKIYRKAQTNEK